MSDPLDALKSRPTTKTGPSSYTSWLPRPVREWMKPSLTPYNSELEKGLRDRARGVPSLHFERATDQSKREVKKKKQTESHAMRTVSTFVMGGIMGFMIGSFIPTIHCLISRVPIRTRKVPILTAGVSMAVIFGFGGLMSTLCRF